MERASQLGCARHHTTSITLHGDSQSPAPCPQLGRQKPQTEPRLGSGGLFCGCPSPVCGQAQPRKGWEAGSSSFSKLLRAASWKSGLLIAQRGPGTTTDADAASRLSPACCQELLFACPRACHHESANSLGANLFIRPHSRLRLPPGTASSSRDAQRCPSSPRRREVSDSTRQLPRGSINSSMCRRSCPELAQDPGVGTLLPWGGSSQHCPCSRSGAHPKSLLCRQGWTQGGCPRYPQRLTLRGHPLAQTPWHHCSVPSCP